MKQKKQKRVTKEQRVESLKEHAKSYAFNYNPAIVDLVKNVEVCKEVTQGTCWRPDIFLNNDRSCNACALVEHCACSCKRVDPKRRNVSR